MAAQELTIEIPATPDAVWAVVGDFGAVADYFPGIEALRMEGDDRLLTTFGIEVRERLVDRDEVSRTITYSVVDGAPFESHRSQISVEPSDAGSRVVWQFEVAPDEMLPLLADQYAKALEGLEAHCSQD